MKYSKILKGFGFIVLVTCGILQMKFSVEEQLLISDKTGKNINESQLRNERVLTHSAKKMHLFEADLEGAQALLLRALTINPVYVPAWLSLAEIYNDEGAKEQAVSILAYVHNLTSGLKQWRWDVTLLAYQLGLTEHLPNEIRYIVAHITGKSRNAALQLAFSVWQDPEVLQRLVGTENTLHLLNYAVKNNLADAALYFWSTIEASGDEWSQKQLLALLDMLMRNDRVADAAGIWRLHHNAENNLYNGNFSAPILQRAFGWQKKENKDFVQQFQSAQGSSTRKILHYRFKGWENINFLHFQQIVPLTSGNKYRFNVEMKADKLTTNERPFWEVYGYRCQADYAHTEMVEPDQEWGRFNVSFSVPEACSAMVIRLRRRESSNIDSKLSGQLWIKNVEIQEITDSSRVLSNNG